MWCSSDELTLARSRSHLLYVHVTTGIATALSGIGIIIGEPLASIAVVCGFSSASLTAFSKKTWNRNLPCHCHTKLYQQVGFDSSWCYMASISIDIDLMYITCLCSVSVSEGKRASGLTAVWVARNRFAVLDRTHNVRCDHWFDILDMRLIVRTHWLVFLPWPFFCLNSLHYWGS